MDIDEDRQVRNLEGMFPQFTAEQLRAALRDANHDVMRAASLLSDMASYLELSQSLIYFINSCIIFVMIFYDIWKEREGAGREVDCCHRSWFIDRFGELDLSLKAVECCVVISDQKRYSSCFVLFIVIISLISGPFY